ncbi:MAG: sigma-70 family RNA polymerase sigma factor [Clostridia bacterium]|nr:sigma-70 family RNA polymerase sigma factor [Clostridia bacterium]
MENLSDEELVARFRSGDKRAGETVLSRYKNKVLSIARRFFLSGGDIEDLVQEGMCGLYSAMTSFEGGGGFAAYAHACIRNRILDAVKKSCAYKNSALNDSRPFCEDDAVEQLSFSPEEMLIDSEAAGELFKKMKGALSPLEYRAICMYIDGATMAEMCLALNKTYKQTDNALVRAKHKLQKTFNN